MEYSDIIIKIVDLFQMFFRVIGSSINMFLLGQFLQKGTPTDSLACLPIIYTDTNLNLIFSFFIHQYHWNLLSHQLQLLNVLYDLDFH